MPGWLSPRSRHGGVDRIPLPAAAGHLWLCGKHFIGPDPEGALAETGAGYVVCLCEAAELVDRYPDYVRWLRREEGGRARWFPVPDLHAPEPAAVAPLLEDIGARLEAGEGVLVHCGAGIGRAGTVAAGVLVSMGVPLARALETVASYRPLAGPEAGAQRQLLEILETHRLRSGGDPPQGS